MDIEKPNYPKNCWWVAATSDEIDDKPLGRWLLDEPVVLYRKKNGNVVALEDRCPHRWAPLSMGKVVNDHLACGYHGFQFAESGRCVKIPSQDKIPEAAKIRTYPVIERAPHIWIWMGDPARKDEVAVPDLGFMTSPKSNTVGNYMHLEANYFLLQENVLDLTHFAFVHATTLELEGWDSGEDEVFITDTSVRFRRPTPQTPLAPFMSIPAGIKPGEICDSTAYGEILLPGVHVAGIDFDDPYRGAAGKNAYHFKITHLTTPESPTTTHYWWGVGQDYGKPGSKENEEVLNIINTAFNQDKDFLEAIQRLVKRDPRHSNSTEISVLADRSALQARKILQDMLARDN